MSRFTSYFLMKPEDVIEYAKSELDIFSSSADLQCKEIGDGNINYIFRVWDKNSDASVVIKQAGHTARISDDFVLSTDRNRIESEILILEHKLAPGLVPLIYKYDETMACCAMEDLSDYVIMRTALLEHQIFPLFAEHISTFMVNTLLNTTDVVMDHKEKKEMVKKYINPELCEISEDLVYTEPFNDYNGRNDVYPANLAWVKENIYGDQALRLEAAKLKFEFLTNAQALIHGDLHTGSIFIKPTETKIIDPEFAFYGPIGYDTGNIVANLIFAWANGDAEIKDETQKKEFCGWVEKTIIESMDMFKDKFVAAWKASVNDVSAKEPGFMEWYLGTVMRDTAAVAGMELSRRVLGLAHVKDIISIQDEAARLRAERTCLTIAKDFIMNRDSYSNGKDFVDTLLSTVAKF